MPISLSLLCLPSFSSLSSLCTRASLFWTIDHPGSYLSPSWLSVPHSRCFGSGSLSCRRFSLSPLSLHCVHVAHVSLCLSPVCLFHFSYLCEWCAWAFASCVCVVCPLSRSLWWKKGGVAEVLSLVCTWKLLDISWYIYVIHVFNLSILFGPVSILYTYESVHPGRVIPLLRGFFFSIYISTVTGNL